MAKTLALSFLRILMIVIFSTWIMLWFLKPTITWTRKWHKVEDSMQTTIFKYNGANFVVYTFPMVALAIVGYLYLWMQPVTSNRRVKGYTTFFLNPLIVRTPVGLLSAAEVLALVLFLTLLVWTFYARVSNDYKKLIPVKSLNLKIWELKFLKVATRLGLLSEICLAFVLLPVLRSLSVFRLLGIQFEASVRYHIWLGTLMIFFATLHGAGTLFIWGINHKLQNEVWRWQNEGRIYLAGEIALITALVIWCSSLPFIRRTRFDVFYYMHHLYIVFIAFFLFHAGDRHFYMVFSGVFLFGLDKLLRIIQSRPETQILSARIFPGKIVELTLPKDPRLKYAPTSIIFIKIPTISNFHWHPFSITSSSKVDDQTMSVMIKCEGWWTNSVYELLSRNKESPRKCIAVAVEGPYGPASFDFMRYDSLLLIGAGIGMTPILSILQEIASAKTGVRKRFPSQIQLIYVTKESQNISLLHSVSHLLLDQSSDQFYHLHLKVFVTQETKGASSVRELLSKFSNERSIILFDTKKRNYILGPENALWTAAITGLSSAVFLLCLCFCNLFLSPSKNMSSKEKTPSTVIDLFLLCSFLIAIACGAFVAIVLRWRRITREAVPLTWNDRLLSSQELPSLEEITAHEEHNIYYGARPVISELLSEFKTDPIGHGKSVGVVVCGPESMKESVALACQQECRAPKSNSKRQQPLFVYHSLNFTL